MRDYNYCSEICIYCEYTDYGFAPVGTGLHNLCEGRGCEDAYINWKEKNPEDDRSLEEMF